MSIHIVDGPLKQHWFKTNIGCIVSSIEGEIQQVTFFLSSMALTFNIVCCLLSFSVCILHNLPQSCAISFSLIPSQILYSMLPYVTSPLNQFTWVTLQTPFLEGWDMCLHLWFGDLTFLKTLNGFPCLKAKQSLHTARSMEELW